MNIFTLRAANAIWLLSVVLALSSGCGISVDKDKAALAKRNSEITTLIFSLEAYKNEHGKLPEDLDALSRWTSRLSAINLSVYRYDPKGISVAGANPCLIVADVPTEPGQVFVGNEKGVGPKYLHCVG